MVVFLRSLQALTVSSKLRLFFISAAILCAGLLFLVFASSRFGADVFADVATEKAVLVIDVNVRNDPDRQDDPEHEFSVEFTNEGAHEADSPPEVAVEGFVFVKESDGEEDASFWEPVEEAGVGHLADAWISGPDSLSDLSEEAVNELDFVVDIPLGTEDGSYTAVIVVRNQAGALLHHKLVVVNVGLADEDKDSRYELELSEKSFDLDGDEVRVVASNDGLWYVSGSMELRLEGDDDAQLSLPLVPESDFPLALFPGFEKAWVLGNQDLSAVKAFIEDEEGFAAELVFLAIEDNGEGEEVVIVSWDVKADISPQTEDSDNGDDEEGNDLAGQQQTTGDGQAGTSSSDDNFLTDNLTLIIAAAGGLSLILVLVLMLVRRRRSLPKKTPTPTPSAKSPPEEQTPVNPPVMPPPNIDVPNANSPGLPLEAEAPVNPIAPDTGTSESLPPETVQDLSLPNFDIPQPSTNEPADITAPPPSDLPLPAASADPNVQPILESMPQLPPVEDVTPAAQTRDTGGYSSHRHRSFCYGRNRPAAAYFYR